MALARDRIVSPAMIGAGRFYSA